MTCQFDRDVQCFESCPNCSRQKTHRDCPECGTETSISELDRYEGKCWDCFFDDMQDDPDRLRNFTKENEELYKEYIKNIYGG